MDRPGYSKLTCVPAPAITPVSTPDPYKRSRAFPPTSQTGTQHNGLRALLTTLWPLILYCISALGIAGFTVFYLEGRDFNLTEREPEVTLPNGEKIKAGRNALLQSDATTILSVLLSLFRWVLATWVASLCWYILFYLMGTAGLPHRDVYYMVTYRSFLPRTYLQSPIFFLIGCIFFLTTLTQFTGPLVTGSVTWIEYAQTAKLASDSIIGVSVAVDSDEWFHYNTIWGWRERVAVQAGGLATIAWGRDLEKGILKRVLPSTATLGINSTVSNVTLPYFSITSIDWIKDPERDLPSYQVSIVDGIQTILSARPYGNPFIIPGSVAFLPKNDWTLAGDWRERPFPSPSFVEETRIMVVYTSYQPQNPDCSDRSRMFALPGPPVNFYRADNACYAYARVTYRAGAGTCVDCRISSPSTVQNDTATPVQLHPDPMTRDALRLMPDVMGNLVLMNSSIPIQWESFDEYVTAVLVRSYSGAWTALAERTSRWTHTGRLFTVVSPSIPTSRADVNRERVFIWLFLQLLVVTLGACFVRIQLRSQHPLTGDTSMVPFCLNTVDVVKPNRWECPNHDEILKVEPLDGHWKIITERTLT